jgi:hypothetical protein
MTDIADLLGFMAEALLYNIGGPKGSETGRFPGPRRLNADYFMRRNTA